MSEYNSNTSENLNNSNNNNSFRKNHHNSLSLDTSAALQHLAALGYQTGDNVYMRGFLPSDDPRKANDYGRKSNKLIKKQVEQWQAEGRGIYFVINGGGHKDVDVKQCRAIFCEHDDIEKELQLNLWKKLGLPEPTIQVDTGGKSIHSYWVFTEPVNTDKWRSLQADLLEFTDADRSIKNPSRVMRLAGAWHLSELGAVQSKIVSFSGKRYNYSQLRGIIQISRNKKVEKSSSSAKGESKSLNSPEYISLSTLTDVRVPVPSTVPLFLCLSRASRRNLNGVSKGRRNSTGAALSRDLIGTANYLSKIGQKFSGDPYQLLRDYGSRCNPALSHKEIKKIWRSAKRDNPTPSCTPNGVNNCIIAWYKRTTSSSNSSSIIDVRDAKFNNGDQGFSFPGYNSLALEEICASIDKLIAQGVTGSNLTAMLNQLAASSQFHIGELRKLHAERMGEDDLETSRDDNRAEVENLLGLTDKSLSMHDYIPEPLATTLNQWCEWLSIRPATVLTALLAGVSSLHKVGTELVIHRAQNFTVPPTLYAALISESGQKKSPIFSNIIRQPLLQLRKEKKEASVAAEEDYEAAKLAWEKSKKGKKPVPPPEPTLYFFTNATGEAIPVQATKDPKKSLLGLIDELSGLFNSANAYRQGRGSDKQDLLSYFDGSGQTVLRASGVKVDLDNIYLSLFGTIQPGILQQHMGDCTDPDGSWARFLLVNQPLSAATLSDDDGQSVEVSECIAWLYRKIDQLPEMEYRLSHQAFKRYQPVYNRLEQLRVTHPQPGMRAVFSKMEGYIGRLALNLHVLWELANGKDVPDEEIPLFIMERAIRLAKFYIGQVKLIHSHSDDEGLAPHITKMIELSKRLSENGKDGWLTARIMQQAFSNKYKKTSANQCREWMNEAVQMGYGQTMGSGNRLKWHWQKSPPDLSPLSPPQSEKEFEVYSNVVTNENKLQQRSDKESTKKVGTVGTTPSPEEEDTISKNPQRKNQNETVQKGRKAPMESQGLIEEESLEKTAAEEKPIEEEDSLLGRSVPTETTETVEPIQDKEKKDDWNSSNNNNSSNSPHR